MKSPRITVLNYATPEFALQQKWNRITARIFGGADRIICRTAEDLDPAFVQHNSTILSESRGAGYWLWKPYFILKQLKEMEEHDILFYSDSGVCFVKNIRLLLPFFELLNQPVLGFELPLIEKQWTKKHLLSSLDISDQSIFEVNQLCATYICIKKSALSIQFFEDFLKHCLAPENLTDMVCAEPNDPIFIDHRHDQSVFSLLYKKYGFKTLRDISDYGLFPEYFFSDKKIVPLPLSSSIYTPHILIANKCHKPYQYIKEYLRRRYLKRFRRKVYDRRFDPMGISYLLSGLERPHR